MKFLGISSENCRLWQHLRCVHSMAQLDARNHLGHLGPDLWSKILRHVPQEERRVLIPVLSHMLISTLPPSPPTALLWTHPIHIRRGQLAAGYFSGSSSACRLRNVPLVSRLFGEACRDPSLWSHLHLLHLMCFTEASWHSVLRWLALRASMLQSLTIGDSLRRVLMVRPVG